MALETLSLAELSEQSGVSERTIRYYIQFGLLPGPEGAGPKASYGQGHLGRLRMIRMLQERHLPLSAIRKVLAQTSEKEIESMAEERPRGSRSSALDYIKSIFGPGTESQRLSLRGQLSEPESIGTVTDRRSHWERIRIAPDIELHVRRPLSKPNNRRLEELMRHVRKLFPEGDTR